MSDENLGRETRALPGASDVHELAGEVGFPPLEILLQAPEGLVAGRLRPRLRPDLFLSAGWEGKWYSFVVEYKTSSTPRLLQSAIQQASLFADAIREDSLPMVIVPYLSPDALDRLIEAEVSGIDLSGNGVVLVPGELFVYRTGARNKFPSSAPIKNVYRGATSLVSRVFFARRAFPSVTEVSKEVRRRGGEISMSTVSKALRGLQEDLVVGREGAIRLLQPARLLDFLTANYRSPSVGRRVSGRVDDAAQTLRRFATNARERGLLVAGNLPSRYVVMPSSDEALNVYTSSAGELLRDVDFEETTRFANVRLLECRDRTVYFDRREADGFFWISPLETYLELANEGKREREAAEQLRADLVALRYQDR